MPVPSTPLPLDRRPGLAALLSKRILVLDGGMGTMLQQAELTAQDFGGDDLEGCNENLVLTRPDVIQHIHEAYLDAGADLVETDTFGATSLVLAEYDLQDQAYAINKKAAELARAACAKYNTEDRPRFVAGSVGPTTKALTVTGGTTFDELLVTYEEQILGLLDGGADCLFIETSQDTLNVKAANLAVRTAFEKRKTEIPVILSATIEPMGTMLGGQGIDAFYTSIEHFEPLCVGMNCATGPEFMTDHLRTLSEIATTYVHVYPNAGLPQYDGTYPETAESLAKQMKSFVDHGWVNLIGGCCGTTPDHIRALVALVDGKAPRVPRTTPEQAVSGTERLVVDPDNRPILVGERTNVIGSLRFKRLVEAEEWEQAAEVGRAQVKKGGQVVDVCLSHTLRDEPADIDAFYPFIRKLVKVPLMVDSTDHVATEHALKHSQGKAIVNSINLEDGEDRFEKICPLLRKYGAAVVVGTIDEDPEQGMAVSKERKLAVAKRSYDLLTTKYGIPPQDIIFDPLVFPCGTGDKQYVGSAGETVEGVRIITEHFPETATILGISNVSFGLPEAGREVLNSVFLYDCVKAGLTYAIVNTQGIERYASIPEDQRKLARDLLYNTREDCLERFVAHYRGKKKKADTQDRPKGTLEERLAAYIVEGTKVGLHTDLDEALAKYPEPLQIINGPLMAGMSEVGRLFNANELIVAEVLQSAEAMKAAVSHLEPHMEKIEGSRKGKVLLATVKGDVHDIGKNLVDIILTNNGYEIIDLGIKCPPERLIQEYRTHKPDAIGLSGLLVKSAQQMVVTVEDFRNAGIEVPVLVGGAALSARFTATKIAPAYQHPVLYAKDAMNGLALLDRLRDDRSAILEENETNQATLLSGQAARAAAPVAPVEVIPLTANAPIPAMSDWNRHVETDVSVPALFDWINPRMLYGKHLGLRGDPEKLWKEGDEKALKLREQVREIQEIAARKGTLTPKAVWRFFPAQSEGETLIVYDPDDPTQERERFTFQRQSKTPGRCLADYVRPKSSGEMDVIAMFAVTAGAGVRERATQWKDEGEYLRSHAYQALALETAEAYAEHLHARIRAQWGVDDGGLTKQQVFQARYPGKRYSFGYPACPALEDQEKLWRLLDPTEIGIDLTEGHMMDPEASVSAIVFWHPEAEYFQV